MQKQRNVVEKSVLEMTEQLKTVLAQRVYAALGEAGVERQKAIKVLSVVNAAIDETYSKYSRPFSKAVDELIAATEENSQKDSKRTKR